VRVCPEENFIGAIYPIELDGNYAFTLYNDEDDKWGVLRENDGNVPEIDKDLHKQVLKKLQWELRYAA